MSSAGSMFASLDSPIYIATPAPERSMHSTGCLDSSLIQQLSEKSEVISLNEGLLFLQGQLIDCAFVIVSGNVDLYFQDDRILEEDMLYSVEAMQRSNAALQRVLGSKFSTAQVWN
jgi:CRP-like cAMP-binding protein